MHPPPLEPSPALVRRIVGRRLVATALVVASLLGVSAVLSHGSTGASASPASEARAAADVAGTVLAAMDRLAHSAAPALLGSGTAGGDDGSSFERLAELLERERNGLVHTTPPGNLGVTLLRADGTAVAWSGRATARGAGRTAAAQAWQARMTPAGLTITRRLLVDGPATDSLLVIVEWWLPFLAEDTSIDAHVIALGEQHVTLTLPSAADGPAEARVLLRAPDGTEVARGGVSVREADARRRRWPLGIRSLAFASGAVGLLSLVGPLMRWRRSTPPVSRVRTVLLVAAMLVGAWMAGRMAVPAEWWPHPAMTGVHYASVGLPLLRSPIDAALGAGFLLGLALCLARFAVVSAGARPSRRLGLPRAWLAGAAVAAAGHAVAWLARDAVVSSTLDLRLFALLSWNPERVLLQLALLATAAAAGIIGTVTLRGLRPWRRPTLATWAGWAVPALFILACDRDRAALLLAAAALAAAGAAPRLCGAVWRRVPGWRIAAAAGLLAIATTGVYAALDDASTSAAREQVGTRLAADVLSQREAVKTQVQRAMEDVDSLADLAEVLRAPATGGADETDRAFGIWQGTALAAPVSSSLELTAADGRLISRFAFNLPVEAGAVTRTEDSRCAWTVSEEVSPFFGEDRRVWRASRAVCDAAGTSAGTITIQATVDRSDLPFLSKVRPYSALQRRRGSFLGADVLGHDVEYAVYGWSGRPLYSSQAAAWALTPAALEAAASDRRPFWTRLTRGQEAFDVLVFSDRGAIHALGVPVMTWLGYATGLAEAMLLSTLAAGLLWVGHAVWRGRRVLTTRALWRSAATSYYRRLLVALVAAAIVPVLGLAFLFRASVAAQIQGSLEQEALRTASAAERAIVDLAPAIDGRIDDDLLVWVSRLVGADVNVYEGSQLTATSGRTLFASGMLSPRTPVAAYRDVVLGLRAESVTEDRLGDLRVITVGVPLGGARAPSIVTVPLALGQQAGEAELAMLDRRVLLVALLFILAGAALGYSLAERMADPVRRLARATRRISRGDLDVTVLVRSADEFRNLADEFNAMAVELRRQRQQLERTHRIEAWSEVARQVAHDIKNPLTPIQLNAEHLRRVHADRGGPLGGVVDACVETILSQVRMLRAIASEFSNFASTPTARVEPASVGALVEELVAPYRDALAGEVSFVTRVPASLPLVAVDAVLTARALSNLLENALQAMARHGTITLEARAERGPDGREGVTLSLVDSGPGMEASALERAFEPYFSTKSGGTGLGLPIARRNIEASGGTVRMLSETGKGTEVRMWWPAAPAVGS